MNRDKPCNGAALRCRPRRPYRRCRSQGTEVLSRTLHHGGEELHHDPPLQCAVDADVEELSTSGSSRPPPSSGAAAGPSPPLSIAALAEA
jgi:hypothetical protein